MITEIEPLKRKKEKSSQPSFEPTLKDKDLNFVESKKKALKLDCDFSKPEKIKQTDLSAMFALFQVYYKDISFEKFYKDLKEKTTVIILREAKSKNIKGFSTISVTLEKDQFGKSFTSVYSGDTVLDKDYWGTSALGVSFLKYLWIQKTKAPFRPLYWFLISKGYKTYLLMANNFKTHFPRYETKTPDHMKYIMDKFYSKKFNDQFEPEKSTIRLKEVSSSLKENVAEISKKDLTVPRIHFFATKNPDWKKGVELACIAEMTFLAPFQYFIKKKLKRKKK